ncbi:Protein CBG07772 [Caenorhabditis briggsae]|uniref:Protein CBG07772 n=1 Tax=Caenorhabditis briggsae TaxID=6238 RepID=A8X443_CAEBR|nr:Protein CBG07772 [Caenorhabditis briggsae]CAP27403.1 Protein CBG07772 [Caenorhabditis briggsae]
METSTLPLDTVTISLPTYQVLSFNQLLVHFFAIIFPGAFFAFDTILLMSSVSSRRDSSIPLAYIVVMCLRGMISNFVLVLQYFVNLITTVEGYEEFSKLLGREFTLLGTFSYLIALVVNVLMSVNRVAVVAKPMNMWFSNTRVFIFCGIIAIIILISLIIPYLSSCYVVFMVNRLAFVSGCAPARHPITTFQNTYTIILPFSCMLVNLGIIFHLRFVRNNSYIIFWHKIKRNEPIRNTSQPIFFSKQRARRDLMMIRQTVTMAIYLSIYEFGAFIIKVFPDLYTELSPTGKQVYFYVRMQSIPLMNFLIYFIETKKTRAMVCRFLKKGAKQDSNLVTVSHHRTVSGPQGNTAMVTN